MPDLDYRPSYRAAAVAGTLVFILYLLTLGPSTAMWDTSEYIAAAYLLGLPHPPGNPFFVLLGRVFSILPIAPNVAMRVNILAALCSATSAAMWFLITERVLVSWFSERWQRIVGGSVAALVGATAFTVWSQSVVNEKVYTVALVGVAVIAWLTVRWCDEPDGDKADRGLILIAYLLGLGFSNHMAGFLAAPAVAFAVMVRRPKTILRWKLILATSGAVLFGMTPFATQPIRAAYFPAIAEGEPTACTTELTAKCTFSKVTWDRFLYNFNRGQYGAPDPNDPNRVYPAQVAMYWMYFKWQWWRDPYGKSQTIQAVLAALFLVLGLFGGWVHWKRDRQSFWFFGPLMLTMTLVLIKYLNFRYGYSQSQELGDTIEREVRDRDYFYLWSFSAWSVWAALGLVFVWESVAALIGSETLRVGKETLDLPKRRSWLIASPVLALAFVPLVGNWESATRKGDDTTARFAHDLLNSVEPYGILVTVGDNDTFPLWYAQEVEGIRKDVVVANTSLLNTEWYTRQLIRNPVRAYDASSGPEIYKGTAWTRPTTPPVKMSMDQADSVPLYYELRDTVVFEAQGIRTKIPPRVLARADYFVLQMIKIRRRHLGAFSGLFLQVLVLCQKAGLVKLGRVALDGTKLKANASKHKAMSYGRMVERETALAAEVKAILDEAEAVDAAEDQLYGEARGDELPPELRTREGRLAKIREAKAALEEEARERTGRADAVPDPKAQRNFTDPESRIMLSKPDGWVQAYNVGAVVDDGHQVIVATSVTAEATDTRQLPALVDAIKANTGRSPRRLLADAGYASEDNLTALAERSIDAYIALGRDRHGTTPPPAPRGRIPTGLSRRERMGRKLRTKAGRRHYARRKAIVEPVFGQIKEARGFRRFSLRGLEQVRAEWLLVAAVHNLGKLFTSGRAGRVLPGRAIGSGWALPGALG